MKRTLCALLAALIMVLGLSVPALADSFDLMMIDAEGGAIMYDTYDLDLAIPYALIPEGSVAIRIATIDWGYCVAFGNYVGYIFRADAYPVDSDDYEYELPTGENYLLNQDGDFEKDPVYVPEFPYDPIDCAPNQQVATRSGPRNRYTSHVSINVGHDDVQVYYQTLQGGVVWSYIEFEKENKMYRLFTPLYRINVDGFLPDDPETDYVWATIADNHTPRLGPGLEYAAAKHVVPSFAKVKAFYQQDGWLWYEYEVEEGKWQRAWAAPGDWY